MAQDIASLGISIDSSSSVQASHNLDAFRDSAAGATRQTQLLRLEHVQARQATQQLSESTRTLSDDLGQANGTLDTLLAKLDQVRQKLNTTQGAFEDFSKTQAQVEALGKAFGVTSTELEAYYRQANQMGLTTQQTVSSLQRITEALQNQTLAGQQVRKVLQDYGVTLAGLKVGDEGKVATQFASQLRSVRDSTQRYQLSQVVFGSLDPDAYAKIDNPAYVTFDQRRQRTVDAQYAASRATAGRNAALLGQQNDRNDAEYADLSSRYNIDVAEYQRKPQSQDERLQRLREIAAHPDSPEARSARGVFGRARDDIQGSEVGQFISGFYNNLGANHAANSAEIEQRYRQDRSADSSALGYRSYATRLGRDFQNDFGLYQGLPDIGDKRPDDPVAKFLADSNTGQRLAGYGDTGLSRRQQATEALKSFTTEYGPARPGTTLDAADGASKDALAAYVGVYGQQEGYARFDQNRRRLERARDTALQPGQGEIDQANGQAALLALPREQRGRAQAFLRFAQGNGVDTTALFAKARSNPGLLQGAVTGTGNGSEFGLTPGQAGAEQQVYDQQHQNTYASQKQDFQDRITLQQQLTEVSSKGSAAAEDLTTQTNAYNEALKAGGDLGDAILAKGRAQAELDEKRRTQAAEQLANLKEENSLLAERGTRVDAAGSDPTGRAAAGYRADVNADYARAKLANPQLDENAYKGQRLQTLGSQASAGGNDIVAGAQQELKLQQQLLSVSGQRADVQSKAQRDQQVELQFVDQRAKAEASGNSAVLEQLERQIAKTKQLKDELAQVNAEAKAFQIGRDGVQAAADERRIAALPRSQQARARALQGTTTQLRDSGLLDDAGSGAGGAPVAVPRPGSPTATFNNNNPTNLRFYPGQVGVTGQSPNGFGIYRTPEDGVAAGLNQMLLDQDRGFNTIQAEIAKRSPPGENKTEALIQQMSQMLGIKRDAPYDLRDPDFAKRFLGANIQLETGRTADGGVLDRGVQLGLDQGGRGALGSGGSTPDTRRRAATAALDGESERYSAGLDTQRQDLDAQHQVQLRGERTARSLIAQGQTGAAQIARAGVYDDIDELGGQRSRQAQQNIREGFATQLASSSAEITQATKDNLALADAYTKGGQAITDVQARLKAEQEARALSLTGLQQEARQRQLVTEAASKQVLAAEQLIKSQKDQNELASADNNLGVFATDNDRATARNKAQTEQYINNTLPDAPDSVKDQVRAQSDQNDAIRQTTERVNSYRDAWQSAEGATTSALNSVVTRSSSAKEALAGLAKDLANLALQAGEKQLLSQGTSYLGGLFGGGGDAGAGIVSAVASAAGNVFPGGTRMFAGGGYIDRPTHFYSAGGQLNLAGEAGDEAIMPLRRMPDGNMGVIARGGGGSGVAVQVHAPITINPGSGASGSKGMDDATSRTYQSQIQQLTAAAVQQAIANERRPGGSLYN